MRWSSSNYGKRQVCCNLMVPNFLCKKAQTLWGRAVSYLRFLLVHQLYTYTDWLGKHKALLANSETLWRITSRYLVLSVHFSGYMESPTFLRITKTDSHQKSGYVLFVLLSDFTPLIWRPGTIIHPVLLSAYPPSCLWQYLQSDGHLEIHSTYAAKTFRCSEILSLIRSPEDHLRRLPDHLSSEFIPAFRPGSSF